ncbi:MAG: SufD family Fe-S cluster assembly protein [bacterium]|nr:SufD family Fe-S cluster assembly protein [bacterium]
MNNILELQVTDKKVIIPESAAVLIIDRPAPGMFPAARTLSVGSGATVQYVLIADEHAEGGRDVDVADGLLGRDWELEPGSSLDAYYIFLGASPSHWHLKHDVGMNAKVESRSLYIGKDAEALEVAADYNFNGRKSFGRVQVDAILNNQANLRYDANINVNREAQLSDTRVDMRLRLNDKEARGRITPALNIAANDVKAGHSAGTYQLSAEDLFYLRSRGLEPEAVRKLLAVSLSRGFIRNLSDAKLGAEILSLIESRL